MCKLEGNEIEHKGAQSFANLLLERRIRMKKSIVVSIIMLIVTCCFSINTSSILYAKTNLVPGDIAIIGVNADDDDQFSFVALVDIDGGVEINFTDNGVYEDGTFRSTEGIYTWTAPVGVSAGDIITITITPPPITMQLAVAGDQIIAYQGSESSPIFIYALQTNSNQWQTEPTSAQNSALPPGLVNGISAVAVGWGSGDEDEWDNAVYNMSITTGTHAEILAAIGDNANWYGQNDPRYTLPPEGSFLIVCLPSPPPTEPPSPGEPGDTVVGGDVFPVDKAGLIAPWIALAIGVGCQ